MHFSFTEDNADLAKKIISRYPKERSISAVLPLLHLAQSQNENYVSNEVISYVADFLSVNEVEVKEVVTFYSMFNQAPVGKYLIQICGTMPCMLRNSEGIEKACIDKLGISYDQTTEDGMFSLKKVECLGACTNAPVCQINNDYYENMDEGKILNLIDIFSSEK